MEVQKCGIRLVYKQDAAEFMQTFMQIIFGIEHQPVHQIPLVTEEGQIIHCDENSTMNDVEKATFEYGWFNLVDKVLRWYVEFKFVRTNLIATSLLM